MLWRAPHLSSRSTFEASMVTIVGSPLVFPLVLSE
jgi:hypothetical protein